ncbi:MAG: hypothetical protein FJY75_12865 [Candidatus Eisenbacteria bacterium]|uniref:Uncharacterized protein n=1 Tax=Eiseniibacteriota bacterium TaxID=2212470 RepID=A0A938BRW3_UNCEI|nr:hypothetical protein [Candidatus Eisenbacteria bacterium]
MDGLWPAREVSPGEPRRRSPLENAPGYQPPGDPEAESVITGRRRVGPIDIPFSGGARTATNLAKIVLDALALEEAETLQLIRLTFPEFRDICWPEFPQSRPATNIEAEDAWGFLNRSSVTGISRGLSDWGGRAYEFIGLDIGEGFSRYAHFNLYKGVRIRARDEAGRIVEIPIARTFIERDGVWKIYGYKE